MMVDPRWLWGVFLGTVLVSTTASGQAAQRVDDDRPGAQFAVERTLFLNPPSQWLSLPQRTKEAQRMSIAQLAAALAADPHHAGAVTEAQIAAVEAPLGARLPSELRELYRGADGVPALGIGPLSQVVPLDASLLQSLRAQKQITIDDLHVFPESAELHPQSMRHFAVVGSTTVNCFGFFTNGPAVEQKLLVDMNEPLLVPGHALWRVQNCDSQKLRLDLRALDLRLLLVSEWAMREAKLDEPRLRRDAVVRARATLEREDVPALVDRIQRIEPADIMVSSFPPFHGPATPAMLDAAEARLGLRMPSDYRTFLALQNGLKRYGLLPAEQLKPFTGFGQEARDVAFLVPYATTSSQRHLQLAQDDLKQCVSVAVPFGGPLTTDPSGGALLWCPRLAPRGITFVYEDPFGFNINAAYATFADWLRDRIAPEIHEQYLATIGNAGTSGAPTSTDPKAFNGDTRVRGVAREFSESENRKVIAALWTMLTQATPVTPQQLQADSTLRLTKKTAVPGYQENKGGWHLDGDGPMTSVFIAADGHWFSIDLDPDRVCVAPSAVTVQTGVNPHDKLSFATDGGGTSSYPEFEYHGKGFRSFMQLSRGCSKSVSITRYTDRELQLPPSR
ncbi:MAG TPA: SMI1/KNR4 family protein [Xanthomonadaceae bacterium]|jgi:cell wall assembly regulator SMI1|nr:SMI1/KNR4 family protein [Xanthomonadaceae bacterium]